MDWTEAFTRGFYSGLDWTEDEKKMYMHGVEDNTTIATFSIKVYYSIEVGEQTGGKIADMFDVMIDIMNKRFEALGALTKAKLHCLEQMTWNEGEVVERYGEFLETATTNTGTETQRMQSFTFQSICLEFVVGE